MNGTNVLKRAKVLERSVHVNTPPSASRPSRAPDPPPAARRSPASRTFGACAAGSRATIGTAHPQRHAQQVAQLLAGGESSRVLTPGVLRGAVGGVLVARGQIHALGRPAHAPVEALGRVVVRAGP